MLYYSLGIHFEWDSDKEKKNIRKHGIAFKTASKVFWDADRLEFYDSVHSNAQEERYITIGIVQDILVVVYTERGNAIRLISARRANSKERELYYGD